MIPRPGLARVRSQGKRASVGLREGVTRDWSAQSAGSLRPSLSLGGIGLGVGAFLAALLILFVGMAIALQVAYSGRMYPGVRALGVPIGGMTRDEARAALAERVTAMSSRSLVIGFSELRWTVAGHHLGVRSDVEPVVEEAYKLGREGSLLSRLGFQLQLALNGASHEVTTPAYDPVALRAFMEALTGAVNRPVQDAQLTLTPEGTVAYVEGQTGRQLEVEVTQHRLEEALADPEVSYVELAVIEQMPRVGAAELASVKAQADLLLSAPLVLKFAELEWQLTPRELATMATVNGTESVQLNQQALRGWAGRLAKEIEQAPENARFTWQNGVLSVLRPSKDGRALDVEQTVQRILAQAFTPERTVALPVSVTRPDVSQDDADKLKIQGVIEVARTSFAGSSPPKQHNITLATQRLNGVVVPPGKMFSFNREVGSTSLDAGYKLGWGIANAGANVKTVPSVAGGICQVATTLFHAVFWSGYQIEERNYHLYWIPGYTSRGVEGLDATVDEEAGLDFRFINNTEDYLLIQSWVEGGRVVFGLYGTKPDWTVKVQPGERTEVTKASQDQVIEEEPTLPAGQRLAVEGAMDGFKVVNTRTVTRSGEEPRILRLTSVYRPSRNVVLVGTGGRSAGPSQVIPNQPTTGSSRESAPARATPAPAATATPAPGPAAKPTAQPAPASKPSSQPAPASKPATQPQPQPTSKPVISPLFPNSGSAAPKPGSQSNGGR